MMYLSNACGKTERRAWKIKHVECPTQINEDILSIYSKGQAILFRYQQEKKQPSRLCNEVLSEMLLSWYIAC